MTDPVKVVVEVPTVTVVVGLPDPVKVVVEVPTVTVVGGHRAVVLDA